MPALDLLMDHSPPPDPVAPAGRDPSDLRSAHPGELTYRQAPAEGGPLPLDRGPLMPMVWFWGSLLFLTACSAWWWMMSEDSRALGDGRYPEPRQRLLIDHAGAIGAEVPAPGDGVGDAKAPAIGSP